jgi:hypothetical protein
MGRNAATKQVNTVVPQYPLVLLRLRETRDNTECYI